MRMIMEKDKDLIFFVAHIDDFEFSCLGFLFKKHSEYKNIKIVIATTWDHKKDIWQKNLNDIEKFINRGIEYHNLNYNQRTLNNNFDRMKNDFYKIINFENYTDIITHDSCDLHSDHTAVHRASRGMLKYVDRFVGIYSPSSYDFLPNYYIEMGKEEYDFKYNLLTMYNFSKEESFSKKGSYFRKEYVNISGIYSLENFINRDMEYSEIYKIYKWVE